MTMQTGDTIIAQTTPPGQSARGVIRLSGQQAFALLNTCMQGTHSLHRGICAAELALPMVGVLPCLIATFVRPHSYTAEDSIEIITAGNPHLLQALLQHFVDHGARLAEPGEFTARAYFNGRLTLAQAEGVAATIAAASDAHLRAAQLLTDGQLGKVCESLIDKLSPALALVEAGIDFVDQEDVVPINNQQLASTLVDVIKRLQAFMSRATGMEQLSALPRVVLVGPPNAGKSTLFNALLGHTRAVVSAESGTTRDVLAEPMSLNPEDPHAGEILLTDIAGLDQRSNQDDVFNPLMQRRAQHAIDAADLIVSVHPADSDSHPATESFSSKPMLNVLSKSDLRNHPDADRFDIQLCSFENADVDRLRLALADRLNDRVTALAADAIALEPRHEHALMTAIDHLVMVQQMVQPQAESQPTGFVDDIELVAAQMRLALDALGQITGQVSPDDVLGHIFATFCVGK